jgi:hypothetical protein
VEITEIEWGDEDALPFSLCISALVEQELISNISIAHGNIVLADHGLALKNDDLGAVPKATQFFAPEGGDMCEERELIPIAPRYRPFLRYAPLTFANELDTSASAAAATATEPHTALPVLELEGQVNALAATWKPQHDLLNSAGNANEFVVEIESDGRAYIRFGDNLRGKRPDAETQFLANYRVGNGTAGNVGADSISHIVTGDGRIEVVRNPLPARGGQTAESMEDVRQRAPYAFRTQERAVTPDDYARVAERRKDVQRAAATFRWTGSWRTVFLTADRFGGAAVDAEFENTLCDYIDLYRMAGHDVEIDGPRHVSLELEMTVCVKRDYFRTDVERALREIFSTRNVFHPDNFTFGQPVYLSQLYAAAQGVAGVDSVEVKVFQRQGVASTDALDSGKLELGRLEIARLDNDPNFPERGVLRMEMVGGK